MASYVLLTRLAPGMIENPHEYESLERIVVNQIRAECPEVRWIASYAVLGPYDYLDVFDAPDNDTATRVGMIVRSFGHATAEVWPATPWTKFREMIHAAHGGPVVPLVLPAEVA